MTVKRLVKKMVYLLCMAAVVPGYVSLLKPASASAEEVKFTQTVEERKKYHLIKVVQRRLTELGYDPGPVNGVNGSKTREAIKKYQEDNELIVDGIPGPQTLKSLGF